MTDLPQPPVNDSPKSQNEGDEVQKMSRAPSGNPIYVVAKIKVEDVDTLMKMGYSLVASEKALFYSKDHTVDQALQYLELHELDEKLDTPIPPKKECTLTPEEKEARAAELQRQLREKIKARESQELKEKERARIAMQRGAHESMAAIQEAERKRQIMLREREKELDEKLRNELRQKQINDYRERFGEDPPEDYFDNQHQMRDRKKARVTELIMGLQRDLINTNPTGPKACFTLLLTYLNNIEKNPLDPKFKRIKMANKHYADKIAPFKEAKELLETIGFQERLVDGESFLILDGLPSHTIGDAIKYLNLLVARM